MTGAVLIETHERTRVLTINRPEARNALTPEALALLSQAFDDASADPSLRCVVLTGASGHFCAGADLRAAQIDDPEFADRIEASIDAFHGLVRRLVRCDKPTVAMMDGAAVGFGADLSFACDLRVASTRAYAQEKFVKIGLMPDGGGTFWLPRLVGTARAMQAILLAQPLDADTLLRLGVVAAVVPPEQLTETTMALARELASGPPLSFAAIKRTMLASWGSFEDALARERDEQIKLLRSADVVEGVRAWAEKRAPRFEGR
jgi:enoyl-CoA hydratase/carnithine racemase